MLTNHKLTNSEFGAHFDVHPIIDTLPLAIAGEKLVTLDCLRLDKVHPFISGNKW